jgi:hypothetical protein
VTVTPDPKQVISAVAEIARRRDMTHMVLSPKVWHTYRDKLNAEHRSKGIGYTMVHDTSILVIPETADHLVFSFSTKSRSRKVSRLLEATRQEDWEEARTMMIELAQRQSRFIHISRLPPR